MKIVFYAPNTALPQEFTAAQCSGFREWAMKRLDRSFLGADVSVSPEGMIDHSSLLVLVEGGTQKQASAAYAAAAVLLNQYIGLEVIEVRSQPVTQAWIGGFFKWSNH